MNNGNSNINDNRYNNRLCSRYANSIYNKKVKRRNSMNEIEQKEIEEVAKDIDAIYSTDFKGDYESGIRDIAKALIKMNYQKVDKDSVVLSKEEWASLQGKAWASTFKEAEISQLKEELDKTRKETVEKYNDKVVAIIQHLFGIGQIDFKAKIEFLKENEKILKQFGVEIKE